MNNKGLGTQIPPQKPTIFRSIECVQQNYGKFVYSRGSILEQPKSQNFIV